MISKKHIRFQPILIATALLLFASTFAIAQGQLKFKGTNGPGKGKNVVLIAGDEEYRSEEALPMLGKLLADKHGFNTTVLFATDPETGFVNPKNQTHVKGLEALKTADAVILLIRFRELPDQEMKYFDEYFKAGKPIIALRTSTHAFNYSRNKNSPYAHYSWDNKSGDWKGGFGKKVLGETWVAHHGNHGKEGTRALVNGLYSTHPILAGIDDIWGETDVYAVKDLPATAKVLLWGQSTLGMTPESAPNYQKSIMPVAWTNDYAQPGGKTNKIFTTTLGTALEFTREDVRRLLVNSVYWATGLESAVTNELDVTIPGTYKPTMFGFDKFQKEKKPTDFEVK